MKEQPKWLFEKLRSQGMGIKKMFLNKSKRQIRRNEWIILTNKFLREIWDKKEKKI